MFFFLSCSGTFFSFLSSSDKRSEFRGSLDIRVKPEYDRRERKKAQMPQNSFPSRTSPENSRPKTKKRSDSFLFESGILLNLCNHRRHGFILLQKSLKIHKLTSLAATPRKQPILSKLGHFKHCYTFVKTIKIKEIHMVFIVF